MDLLMLDFRGQYLLPIHWGINTGFCLFISKCIFFHLDKALAVCCISYVVCRMSYIVCGVSYVVCYISYDDPLNLLRGFVHRLLVSFR